MVDTRGGEGGVRVAAAVGGDAPVDVVEGGGAAADGRHPLHGTSSGLFSEPQALPTAGQRKQAFSEFTSKLLKEQREAKQRRKAEAREQFRALLQTSGADGRATYEDLAKLVGADPRWTGLERSERETEVRFYLQSVKQKARDEEKARRKQELDALHAVLDGMALEPTARWSEKEAEVQEKFHGSIITGKALRDLFYDYLDQLRERREKEQKQRQKEFRQFLFDVLEKLLNENRIRPEFHWEEVEAVMTDEEKPRFPDVKLSPQPILNEFIDKVNNRVRFEEKVGVSEGVSCSRCWSSTARSCSRGRRRRASRR